MSDVKNLWARRSAAVGLSASRPLRAGAASSPPSSRVLGLLAIGCVSLGGGSGSAVEGRPRSSRTPAPGPESELMPGRSCDGSGVHRRDRPKCGRGLGRPVSPAAEGRDAFGMDLGHGPGLCLHGRPIIRPLGSFSEIKESAAFAWGTYVPAPGDYSGAWDQGGCGGHRREIATHPTVPGTGHWSPGNSATVV